MRVKMDPLSSIALFFGFRSDSAKKLCAIKLKRELIQHQNDTVSETPVTRPPTRTLRPILVQSLSLR